MFRPVKIRHYLALMQAKGHDAAAVLAGSGVDVAQLSDPDCLLDIAQAKAIVANMIALSGDQGIGLEAGRRTDLLDLGLVGYVIMSASSAHEAVRYWINYSNSLVGMMMTLRLDEHAPDDWALTITESVPLGFIYNFCAEEILTMIYRFSGELTGTTPVMTQLELSYPAPSHEALYRQSFAGPIRFNAPATRIRFSAPRLDLPIRGVDKEFNELCARQCELMMRRVGGRNPWTEKIRNVLMRLGGRTPSIELVARELNVSPRSLRRHLADEGLGYQKLLDDFRTDMAKEYLRSPSMSSKEIAYLLGFRDTNSFRRAFKSWTGQTVLDYRKSLQKPAAVAQHVLVREA